MADRPEIVKAFLLLVRHMYFLTSDNFSFSMETLQFVNNI